MEKIKSILTKEISKKGYISISRFMEISLTDPKEGYYINQKPLGKSGDFITSPDITQIFGEVIGAWAIDIINKINSKASFQIIDLGGGRGTLLKDIKRVRNDNSISYGFLEINKNLITTQKQIFPEAKHYKNISDIPDFPTIFIGNEFLDVFPIRQYIKINKTWKEVFVTKDSDRFLYCYEDIEDKILFEENKKNFPNEADFLEVNTMIKNVVRDISIFLKRNNGICLIIDYGYSGGYGNTLQAIKNHEYVDPLSFPGSSDLTSHINFSQIINETKNFGMNFFGPISQRNFLINLGALERLEILKKSTNSEKIKNDLDEGLLRVIENSQMGELFKVCAISPNNKLIPEGFD